MEALRWPGVVKNWPFSSGFDFDFFNGHCDSFSFQFHFVSAENRFQRSPPWTHVLYEHGP